MIAIMIVFVFTFSVLSSLMPLFNLLTSKNVFSHFSFFFLPFHELFIMTTKFLGAVCCFGTRLWTTQQHLRTSQRFKENDYEVVRKDGLVFLREMAAEVKNFMDFKMSAVMVSHLFATAW